MSNAYNGMIRWTRNLKTGFMIHRNTLIAAPETVYLGGDESCKMLDAATGALRDEITPAEEIAGGRVFAELAPAACSGRQAALEFLPVGGCGGNVSEPVAREFTVKGAEGRAGK